MSPPPQEVWEFEGFTFYSLKGEVHYEGEVRPLSGIPSRLLLYLVISSPRPVELSELVAKVWGVAKKEDVTVRGAVKQVRDVLRPRRDLLKKGPGGYYLAAEIHQVQPDGIILEPLPGAPKIKIAVLKLFISTAIQEMTGKGWAAKAIEWIVHKMHELHLGQERKEVLLYFWLFHATRGEFETALSYAEQCLEFAKKADDPLMRRAALTGLSVTFIHLGNLRKASEILAEASRDLSTTQEVFDDDLYIVEPGSAATCQEGLVAWFLGYPQKALTRLAQARQRAERFRHAQTNCLAQVYSAWVHQLRREPEKTLAYANQAIALSEKHNLRQLRPWGMMLSGWAKTELHQADEGIEQMRESLSQQKEMRSKIARTYFLVLLADALRQDGAAALETLDEAAREVDSTKERFFESEIQRIHGEILAAHFGHLDKAADCFRRAIRIANDQGARLLELRSHIAWGNILADRPGRVAVEVEQSHRALKEIYDSFSEGHDTRDLIDARLLLEKLRSKPTATGFGICFE